MITEEDRDFPKEKIYERNVIRNRELKISILEESETMGVSI